MTASPLKTGRVAFETWRDALILLVLYLFQPESQTEYWPVLISGCALFFWVKKPQGKTATVAAVDTAKRVVWCSLAGLACAYVLTPSIRPFVVMDSLWLLVALLASVSTPFLWRLMTRSSLISDQASFFENGVTIIGFISRLGSLIYENCLAVIGLVFCSRLWPERWLSRWDVVVAGLLYLSTTLLLRKKAAIFRIPASIVVPILFQIGRICCGGGHWATGHGAMMVVFSGLIGGGLLLRRFLSTRDRPAEDFRLSIVLGVGFWLYQPIAYPVVHGTGDALWYSTMLADMLEQVRSGVFPVWSGQSIFQFNGAIYPLRVAPAFHYIGALFDLITLRTLNAIAVQNLMLVSWAVFAAGSAYLALAALLPSKRTFAVFGAILFVASPGVMSVVYNTDLYMSWMTIPFLPIVFYAVVRSFERLSFLLSVALGLALGLMWWGHTPIALWTTLIVGVAQLVRLIKAEKNRWDFRMLAVLALVFVGTVAYPIASVLFFPPEPSINATGFQRADASSIAMFIKQAFPDVILPVKNHGQLLSSFQLGYSLWIILFGLFIYSWRFARTPVRLLTGVAGIFVILLTPIPHFNQAVWSLIPAFIRDTTGNWVMNRLYSIFAATIVFSGAALLTDRWKYFREGARQKLIFVLAALCLWSLFEGRKFGVGANTARRSVESGHQMLQPENVMITRFAYLVYPRLPDYFSHGVVDPELEHRFFSEDGKLVWSNAGAIIDAWKRQDPRTEALTIGSFSPDNDKNSVWSIAGELPIKAGQKYLAVFDFSAGTLTAGVLQFSWNGEVREYEFPLSGGTHAFGSGPGSAPYVPLWTTDAKDVSMHVKFFPSDPTAPSRIEQVGLTLVRYQRSLLPLTVSSWVPYRVKLSNEAQGWLETPRSFHTDFLRAAAPGAVKKSDQDLVMVHVPPGTTELTISSDPPVIQKTLFWISIFTILSAFVYTLYLSLVEKTKFKTAAADLA